MNENTWRVCSSKCQSLSGSSWRVKLKSAIVWLQHKYQIVSPIYQISPIPHSYRNSMGGTLELRRVRRLTSKVGKSIMKSHHLRIPKYEMPLRFRPVITRILPHISVCSSWLQWFLIFTSFIMVVLAFLGFTNFSRSLPLNDKLLHFLCFCIATGVFYFIIDVEECVVNCYGTTMFIQILSQQECKTNMVLEAFSINFHRIHMFLLWWYSKWISTSRFTSWVFLVTHSSFYILNQAQFKQFEWGDVLVRLISMMPPVRFLTSVLGKSSRI